MEILQYPDAKLREPTEAVDKVTPELAEIAKEMYITMKAANGIGLAAPQVGLSIRLIVLDNDGVPLYMFNPKILQESKDKHSDNEACLSFPNITKRIPRAYEVVVKYRDINNGRQFIKATGLLARAIQHEINHLDGILLVDMIEKA